MDLHLELNKREQDGILRRLRRIEGQIKGLQRMLHEQRDCAEIIQQLAAARAALDHVAIGLLTAGLEHCLDSSAAGTRPVKGVVKELHHSLLVLR
jgi:DNA-binding FrmR family transcriptional regulator